MKHSRWLGALLLWGAAMLEGRTATAQDTRILGFADVTSTYTPKTQKVSFGLGEWDLFITSDISDRISFLGETVFKYDANTASKFSVGVERIIVKYNVKGNHNVVVGKIHTPINYWNDTYHHGRVLFPTIYRPAVFNEGLLPLHTLGAGVQGQNLGTLRFGYDLMVGNGMGSLDQADNDMAKSVTAAIHVKPVQGLRISGSAYFDRLAAGATGHQHGAYGAGNAVLRRPMNQRMFTGSVAYFRKEVELLAENSYIHNRDDSTHATTNAFYVYAGVRPFLSLVPKLVVYGRYDNIRHPHGHDEMYFVTDNLQSVVGGLRYEFNYLAVLKLEYQRDVRRPMETARLTTNTITAQVAVGF